MPAIGAPPSRSLRPSSEPPIPPCDGVTAVTAELVPGVYYDPVALSALTTTCAAVTLRPGGVYWLDFPSTSTPWHISQIVRGPARRAGNLRRNEPAAVDLR